jgi:hypothetical protein
MVQSSSSILKPSFQLSISRIVTLRYHALNFPMIRKCWLLDTLHQLAKSLSTPSRTTSRKLTYCEDHQPLSLALISQLIAKFCKSMIIVARSCTTSWAGKATRKYNLREQPEIRTKNGRHIQPYMAGTRRVYGLKWQVATILMLLIETPKGTYWSLLMIILAWNCFVFQLLSSDRAIIDTQVMLHMWVT